MRKVLALALTLAWPFLLLAGSSLAAPPQISAFLLKPNPKFGPCAQRFSTVPLFAVATVAQGPFNDTLTLRLANFKPGLAFDLFTIQKTNLKPDGTLNPSFTNFGLAWYQSDVVADVNGAAFVDIHTILINQIFGFDPAVGLTPTNTFHVGIWFNDPADASACGFTGFTPFNGEHHAGPNAMITVPNATTGLGPLCLHPSTTPGVCNP
jgi:hypothetical protein